MVKHLQITLIFVILLSPTSSLAHPGNTDSVGCHTCRTNCSKWGLNTGEYHCHKAKNIPQPKEPIKSHYSETGGYTTPAPEYKIRTITTPTNKTNDNVKKPVVTTTTKYQSVTTKNTPVKVTKEVKKTNNTIFKIKEWFKKLFK